MKGGGGGECYTTLTALTSEDVEQNNAAGVVVSEKLQRVGIFYSLVTLVCKGIAFYGSTRKCRYAW